MCINRNQHFHFLVCNFELLWVFLDWGCDWGDCGIRIAGDKDPNFFLTWSFSWHLLGNSPEFFSQESIQQRGRRTNSWTEADCENSEVATILKFQRSQHSQNCRSEFPQKHPKFAATKEIWFYWSWSMVNELTALGRASDWLEAFHHLHRPKISWSNI